MKHTKPILFVLLSLLVFGCNNLKSINQQITDAGAQEKKDTPTNTEIEMQDTGQQFLLQKHQDGIDFYATGNEPSWSLDLDVDKGFHFKTMNGVDFSAPTVDPTKSADGKLTTYTIATESGEMTVILNHTPCTDTMKGDTHAFTVSVDFKTTKEANLKRFEGCGAYVPNYTLHDIWAITEVEGVALNPSDFNTKYPQLELSTTTGTVFGNDGCNTFRGLFEMRPNELIFGNLAGTMMACPNMEISAKITKALANKTVSYVLENNRLVFMENGKPSLKFKKVD